MKYLRVAICLIAGLLLLTVAHRSDSQAPSYTPPNGFVPDARTAIAVGIAVLNPIYGEKQIRSERPFTATLKDGVWTVNGSLPEKSIGGVASIRIDKKDGHIYSVIHGK